MCELNLRKQNIEADKKSISKRQKMVMQKHNIN